MTQNPDGPSAPALAHCWLSGSAMRLRPSLKRRNDVRRSSAIASQRNNGNAGFALAACRGALALAVSDLLWAGVADRLDQEAAGSGLDVHGIQLGALAGSRRRRLAHHRPERGLRRLMVAHQDVQDPHQSEHNYAALNKLHLPSLGIPIPAG